MLPLIPFPDNVSDWNPGICQGEVPLTLVTKEADRMRATLGLVGFLVFTSYHVISLSLMLSKRRLHPLNKRDNGLITLSGIAALSLTYASYFRDVIGYRMFNCEEFLFHGMLYIPLQMGPTILRLLTIRNRVLWNRQKDNLDIANTMRASLLAAMARAKKRASPRYTAMACIVLITPSIFLIVFDITTSNRFWNGCVGCSLTKFNTNVFTIFGVTCCVAGLFLIRRLSKVDSKLPELKEIKVSLAVGGVLGVSYTITSKLTLPWEYDSALLLHFVGAWLQYNQCILPTLSAIKTVKTIRNAQVYPSSSAVIIDNGRKNKPKELIDIIETVQGMAAFTEHVTKEYNVENIKFWHDVVLWKRDYTLSRASPSDLKKRSFNIFNAYVPDSALLQVNLDNSQRITLEELFKDALDNDKLVAVDAFDEAEEEILNLMIRDSFPRFKASPAYPEFVEKVWPTAEDW